MPAGLEPVGLSGPHDEVAALREEVSLLNEVVAALLPELRLPPRGLAEVQQAAAKPARLRGGKEMVIEAARWMRPSDGP